MHRYSNRLMPLSAGFRDKTAIIVLLVGAVAAAREAKTQQGPQMLKQQTHLMETLWQTEVLCNSGRGSRLLWRV